jgi:hypothetical protein
VSETDEAGESVVVAIRRRRLPRLATADVLALIVLLLLLSAVVTAALR